MTESIGGELIERRLAFCSNGVWSAQKKGAHLRQRKSPSTVETR
jgi:hypothetical protein